MNDLILDLLEWLKTGPKPYDEVLEVWRTSCPRLTVWEDATDAGYVERHTKDGTTIVKLSDLGRRYLAKNRPAAA